jgi:hypothetical protein
MRMPFTPRCHTATRSTLSRICVRLAAQPAQTHRHVDDVRQVEVDQGDHEQRRVAGPAEETLGDRPGERDQQADEHRRVDGLDDDERRDHTAPERVVLVVEIEAGEDAAEVDEHVDQRHAGEDELEPPEVGRRDEMRVERDEQEGERLEEDAGAAVDRGVVRERRDPAPRGCDAARSLLEDPFLGMRLRHGGEAIRVVGRRACALVSGSDPGRKPLRGAGSAPRVRAWCVASVRVSLRGLTPKARAPRIGV